MKYLIEMPDDWHYIQCLRCGPKPKCGISPCPLSNAVKAVEVKGGNIDRVMVGGKEGLLAFGKPVRLFAVEDK